MKPIYSFLLLLILSTYISTVKADLIITELMQSNVTGLMDDTSDFPDSWVELYNSGSRNEILSEYKISIEKGPAFGYQLPDSIIHPNSYVVVYCDKKDAGMHTPFRLESTKKGTVYLYKNNKEIQSVSHPAFPAPDIAYGKNSSGNWGYETIATPGEANKGSICKETHILPDPLFNIEGGVFSSPQILKINLPENCPKGTVIRYTTNGDTPGKESEILNPDSVMSLSQTTVIRARLECENWLSPFPVTHSYIFPDRNINTNIISLSCDVKFLYNWKIGIFKEIWKDWRRPANVELFTADKQEKSSLNQLIEFRLSGQSSRQRPLKSMILYANKRFGEKRLNYEFFPDDRPGQSDFKSILLRNAGNDFYESYMRDAVVHKATGSNMGLDFQAENACVIYINGAYFGILHIRERSNEDNIYSNYEGLEDIDMIENWKEINTGSMDEFNNFWDIIHADNPNIPKLANITDVKECLDVHLANIYFNNCDFPGNNTVFWRPQEENGKWRMMIKDTDYAMGLKYGYASGNPSDFPTLDWLYTNGYPGANNWGNKENYTLLFRLLLSNQDIFDEFVERTLVYLGDFLNAKEIISVIDKIYNSIKEEWPYHAMLYEGADDLPLDESSLDVNVNYIKDWIIGRDSFFVNHFAEFYRLGKMKSLHVIPPFDHNEENFLTMNDYRLKTNSFHGSYPVDKKFKISYDTKGHSNLHWNIYEIPEEVDIPGEITAEFLSDPLFTKTTLEGKNISLSLQNDDSVTIIQPVLDSDATIQSLKNSDAELKTRIFDLNGHEYPDFDGLLPGIYIINKGCETSKFIKTR